MAGRDLRVLGLGDHACLRIGALMAFYFVQGLPTGFLRIVLKPYLRVQGLSLTAIASFASTVSLPWMFRFLWGPAVDRCVLPRLGHRLPWIVAAEFGMGFSLVWLVWANPTRGLGLPTLLLVLCNTFASVQDVAVDALAIDVLPVSQRGLASSLMWASKLAASTVGGWALAQLKRDLGWAAVPAVMACAVWAVMVLAVFLREPERGHADSGRTPVLLELLSILGKTCAQRTAVVGAALALTGIAGRTVIETTMPMFLVDAGFSHLEVAGLLGLLASIPTCTGGLLGGTLSDLMGRSRAIAVFTALMAAWALFAAVVPLSPSHPRSVTALIVGFNLSQGMVSVAWLSLYMDLTNPAIAASHFTLYMSLWQLCEVYSEFAAGVVADAAGYSAVLCGAAIISFLPLLILLFLGTPQWEERASEAAKKD